MVLCLLRLYRSSLPRYPPPPLHCLPRTNTLLVAFPIISTLFVFCTCSIYGYPNAFEDPLFRHQKTLLMRGIKGINAERETQKLSITPDVLHKMQCHLHLDSAFDVTFWAACLVAFFPSSVISQTYCHLPPHQAPPAKMRCSIVPWDIILVVRWYIKTIQYRDRTLPASSKIVHCSLCPWSAVACAFKLGVFIKILNLL